MNKVSFVKDVNTDDIHSIVVFDDISAKALAVHESAVPLVQWVNDSRATFNDIKNVLSINLQQEAPFEITGKSLSHLKSTISDSHYKDILTRLDDDAFIQVGETHRTMGSRYVVKGVQRGVTDSLNVKYTPINNISSESRQNLINAKAVRFRTEQKVTSLSIQTKRVRAIFDPNVGPGGGWRCPEGTMYGGQITDRFGRGCGGGLTRRLGRALMRAGQRLDNFGIPGDQRRLARAARRAEGAREQGASLGQRVNRGRTRVASRLDDAADRLVGDFAPSRPRRNAERRTRRVRMVPPGGTGAGEEAPVGRRAQNFEILEGGERGRRWRDLSDDDLRAALDVNDPAQVDDPDARERVAANRENIRREISRRQSLTPERRRREEERRNAAARRGRQDQRLRPRRPGQQERGEGTEDGSDADPFGFIEDPEKREVVREALGEYADEIADLIQNRRRGERRRRGTEAEPRRRRAQDGDQGDGGDEDRQSLVQRIIQALARAFQRFQEARENRRQNRDERRERRNARRVRLANALDDAASRILDDEGVPQGRRRDRVADALEDAADRIENPDVTPARRRRRRTPTGARRPRDVRPERAADDMGVVDPATDPEMRRQYREERGIPDNIGDLNDEELGTILEVMDDEERVALRDPDGFDPFRAHRREQRRLLRAEQRRRSRQRADEARTPEATPAPAPSARRTIDEVGLRGYGEQRGIPENLEDLSDNELDTLLNVLNAEDREARRNPDANDPYLPFRREQRRRLRAERRRRNRPPTGPGAFRTALEGSEPDEASVRNVRNRFPENGLPDRAFWREEGWEGRGQFDREDHEDRFGRYYDDEGNLNERGRFVNERLITERSQAGGQLNDDQRDSIEADANQAFDAPQAPEGANVPTAPESPATPDTGALEGSVPDSRSLRNVRNRFPRNGLPRRAAWRDRNRTNYNEDNEREMDRRFSRYYDGDGKLNDRGRWVNARLRQERENAGRNLTVDQRDALEERANTEFDQRNTPEGAPNAPEAPRTPATQVTPEEQPVNTGQLEGSVPDSRSFRNVNNRFRSRGLPQRATWRNRNDSRYTPEREAEMDRRFGRYYDADGQINDRGRFVNQRLTDWRERNNRVPSAAEAEEILNDADRAAPVAPAEPAPATPSPRDANSSIDDAFKARAMAEGEGSLRAELENLTRLDYAPDDDNNTSTPDRIRQLESNINKINDEYRLATAKLEANGRGELELSGQERLDLINYAARLNELRLSIFPGHGDIFGADDRFSRNFGVGPIREGIFNDAFDGAPRAEYIRAYFGLQASLSSAVDTGNTPLERLNNAAAVVASWEDIVGGERTGLSNTLAQLGDISGLSDDDRQSLMTRLAFASYSPSDMSRLTYAETGLTHRSLADMGERVNQLKSATAALTGENSNRMSQVRDVRDLSQRIQDVQRLNAKVVGAIETMRFAENGSRQLFQPGAEPNSHPFIASLGDHLAATATVDGNGVNPFAMTDAQVRRIKARQQVWTNAINDLLYTRFGDDRDRDVELLARLTRLRDSGAVNLDSSIASGLPPSPDDTALGRSLSKSLALTVARDNTTAAVRDARIRDIQTRWGIVEETIGQRRLRVEREAREQAAEAARIAQELEAAAAGVVDQLAADGEGQQMIAEILRDAEVKRRRRITEFWRRKNGSDKAPWEAYKERNNGQLLITKATFNAVTSGAVGDAAKKRVLRDYIKNMYEVQTPPTPGGGYVATKVTTVTISRGQISLGGNIVAHFEDGSEMTIGDFSRNLTPGKVYSARFMFTDYDLATKQQIYYDASGRKTYQSGALVPDGQPTTKGSGLASLANGQSWGWLKAGGFKEVGVGAASDGPYIWARTGYRSSSAEIREQWKRMNAEIVKFSRGEESIIDTPVQARMLAALSKRASDAQYDQASAPSAFEMIYALEHGSTGGAAGERARKVKGWIRSNAPVSSATLYLDQHNFDPIGDPPDPDQPNATYAQGAHVPGGNMLPGLLRPQAPEPIRGSIATRPYQAGDLPEPRVIVNPNITTRDQAAEAVRNGTSLDEIPNEFWMHALQENASTNPSDTTKRFHLQVPRAGAMADTKIYTVRDADGRPTNQGVVIKGTKYTIRGGKLYDDAYAEVAGYNLAAAAGLMPEGAGYVGNGTITRNGVGEATFVAIPFGPNLAADNRPLIRPTIGEYGPSVFAQHPTRGLEARTTHALFNFFLGSADRHNKNAGAYLDAGGNLFVVPFDLGRIDLRSYYEQARAKEYLKPGAKLGDYMRRFSMDRSIFADMDTHMGSLPRAEAERFRQSVLERYDDMVSRMRVTLVGGRDEFIRRMSVGSPDVVGGRNIAAERDARLGGIYDHLKEKLDNAQAHRDYLKGKMRIRRGQQ